MDCRIVWDGIGTAEWDRAFGGLRRAPLLQSRPYAEAVCPPSGQRPRRGEIRIAGARAGLVQIREAALCRRAIHAVILDRGPVWLDGFGDAAQASAFWAEFCRGFPARIGRRRRVIPEQAAPPCPGSGDLSPLPARPGYQTIWLDITAPEEVLRRRLKPKWRNMLNKAERAGVEIRRDWSGRTLAPFLALCEADRREKGYPGPDAATLRRLAGRFAQAGGLCVATAEVDGTPVAGALFLLHGRSATWQAGWVGQEGRASAANHLLLWRAMLALKSRGIADLDLGGVNDASAAGVKRFKEGMGGTLVTLAGQYR